MSTLSIRAADGARVPYEGNPRQFITPEAGILTVPDSHYYRQQIRDGDLVEDNDLAQAAPIADADSTSPATPVRARK